MKDLLTSDSDMDSESEGEFKREVPSSSKKRKHSDHGEWNRAFPYRYQNTRKNTEGEEETDEGEEEMDMNAINTFVDERVITRHLVSRPPSGPPPTHLYGDPSLVPCPSSGPPPTDLYGGPANVLGANVNGHLLEDPASPSSATAGPANELGDYVKRHLLVDPASPSSATAAVERRPPIEERRKTRKDVDRSR